MKVFVLRLKKVTGATYEDDILRKDPEIVDATHKVLDTLRVRADREKPPTVSRLVKGMGKVGNTLYRLFEDCRNKDVLLQQLQAYKETLQAPSA